MASSESTLNVLVSPTAADELFEIWRRNLERYGLEHAEEYEAFLIAGIDALDIEHDQGKPVARMPELRSLTLKRKARGDGHVVIYRTDLVARSVDVLHIFHTKMDIGGRLDAEV